MKYIVLVVMAVVVGGGIVLALALNQQYQHKRRRELMEQLGAAMVLYRDANRGAWPIDMDLIDREHEGIIARIEAAWEKPIDRIFVFVPEAKRKNEMVVINAQDQLAVFGDGHVEELNRPGRK